MMPLSSPIKCLNGQEISKILIPKNTTITISALDSNRNIEIWGPDSLEWIPERWVRPLPPSFSDAHIPGIYSHMWVFRSHCVLVYRNADVTL